MSTATADVAVAECAVRAVSECAVAAAAAPPPECAAATDEQTYTTSHTLLCSDTEKPVLVSSEKPGRLQQPGHDNAAGGRKAQSPTGGQSNRLVGWCDAWLVEPCSQEDVKLPSPGAPVGGKPLTGKPLGMTVAVGGVV
jgi:hypothetical protein